FFAFLFKIGFSFSRGSFLIFIAVAPVGLLAGRKLEKDAVQRAVARGAIGRRNVVLVGDQDELASLENRDLLAMLGAGEVNRFSLAKTSEGVHQRLKDLATLSAAADFARENK